MKKSPRSILTDISFLIWIVLIFVGILYLQTNRENLVFNGAMLCVTMAFVIITYFTTLTTGIAFSIVGVAVIICNRLFLSASEGLSIPLYEYFWILWMPAMTILTGIFVDNCKNLTVENVSLKSTIKKTSTISEAMKMGNLLAFQNDCNVYFNIARRYNMNLDIIVWRLKNHNEIEKIIGKSGVRILAKKVAESIRESSREEDLLYVVGNKPYEWCILLFGESSNNKVIIERVKEKIDKIDQILYNKKGKLNIQIYYGEYKYSADINTPLEYLNLAKDSIK